MTGIEKIPHKNASKSILNKEIQNFKDQSLGFVRELVKNPEDGTVEKVLLEIRGDETGKAKFISIPWEMLDSGTGGELRLDIEPEFLQRLPGYSAEESPEPDAEEQISGG